MPIVVSEFAHMMGGGPQRVHSIAGEQVLRLNPGTVRVALRADFEDVLVAVKKACTTGNGAFDRVPAFGNHWINVQGASVLTVKKVPRVVKAETETETESEAWVTS